ncbi:unnamed protein product [Dicrocoelium dendriticum]|nr:unnamed protein product [Dicrocoelium dendriticum]
MHYLAAFMLCRLGGNESPSAADIENVLASVGIESDFTRMKQLMDCVSGSDITKLMADGFSKMAAVPTGAAAVRPAEAVTTAAAEPAKEAPKKEEVKEESESDEEMGFGLFD